MSDIRECPHAAPVRAGRAIAAFEAIDTPLRGLALAMDAQEMQFPVLIDRATLERAEYHKAFPHLLMAAAHAEMPDAASETLLDRANLTSPRWCLSPAVCYHCYAWFAGQTLDRPLLLTARGRCFRHEATSQPGMRQVEFEMREVVLLGPPDWVKTTAGQVQDRVTATARGLGLQGDWRVAEDPFFLPKAQGKAVMQRLLETKMEYQSDATGSAGGTALASVNHHGAFFGQRFGISAADGQPIHTACIAAGLDRWATLAGATTPSETTP